MGAFLITFWRIITVVEWKSLTRKHAHVRVLVCARTGVRVSMIDKRQVDTGVCNARRSR